MVPCQQLTPEEMSVPIEATYRNGGFRSTGTGSLNPGAKIWVQCPPDPTPKAGDLVAMGAENEGIVQFPKDEKQYHAPLCFFLLQGITYLLMISTCVCVCGQEYIHQLGSHRSRRSQPQSMLTMHRVAGGHRK